MDSKELVLVIDFGGQYNQLVARRVRECNVYCEITSYKTPLDKIREMKPKGIILTGGPNSCYEEGAPSCSKELFELGIPAYVTAHSLCSWFSAETWKEQPSGNMGTLK